MSLFPEINTENKLRLTLTYLAMNTLREDQKDFDMGIAALVNRIIAYYSTEAKASISIRLSEYKKSVESTLGDRHREIIDALVSAEKKNLMESVPVYRDRPESFLLRINNSNMFLLTEDPTSGEEEYYSKGIKAYAEALVEEFCRLPFIKRERIYYKDIYDQLAMAMKNEYAVYIEHSFGKRYLIRIYDLTTDSLSTYTYVVCRLINMKNKQMNGRIYSFRLSRIEKVIAKPSVSGAFTAEEKKSTANAIASNGVQFVSDRINTIVVRFTNEGLKMFNSNLHLRPHISKTHDDGHTFEFECTSGQAIFYFRRLGATAKIIKPAFVAKELAIWFQNAAETYPEYRNLI